MTVTAAFPGGAPNTFVPSTEATGNMVVDYSRNVNDFALNSYVQIVPVTKSVGLYTFMTVEEAGRITDSTGADSLWPDGEDAPDDRGGTESFQFLPYQCQRRSKQFRIGQLASTQASWDILAQHARIKCQQMMTIRTQLVVNTMTTTANYNGQYSDVTSITGTSGGRWDISTAARQDIRRSLAYAQDIVRKAVLGAVTWADFRLVISPGCARKLAACQEIVNYIQNTPYALDYIKGKLGPAAAYGLPDMLYGTPVVIEDAYKTTTRKGAATTVKSTVLSDSTPFLCCRPSAGGDSAAKAERDLVAPVDSNQVPRYATAAIFMIEEMTVEQKYDADNRLNRGRVVENYVAQMVAPQTGFLFTNAVS